MKKTKQYKKVFLITKILLLTFITNIIANDVPYKLKLTPSEWWTAPYKAVFDDAELAYSTQPQVAYQILDVIIKRASYSKEDKWLYEAYRDKGLYLERQLAFQAALHNYLLAEKAIENKDPLRSTNIQIDIAIMYRNLYRYVEARHTYFSLIEKCLQEKDSTNLQNAYGGLGVLFFTVNDYENAVRYYNKALQLSRETHNYINECIYLDNLSEAFGCLKQYDKAFEHIALACQIAESKDDKDSKIPLYERYAHLYARVGEFDKAFSKIDNAIQLCDSYDYNRDRNNLIIAKAELYLNTKNINAALLAFKSIDEKMINVNSLTKVYHELGKIYEQKLDLTLAESYFKKSQLLAAKNQALRYDEWNHRALYRIYRIKNLPSKALAHLECANALRDSFFNYEKSGQVTELQFHYDLSQSEQKLKEVQLHSNKIVMIATVLISCIAVIFLAFWAHIKNKKNKALESKKQQIELQKAQLELFNDSILAKNKEIEEQKQLLEESNGMLRQFSYAVAHDLKEPMRNIGNFTKIIQKKYISQLPVEAVTYFDFVTHGVSRMSNMLEGLLRYSMMSINQVTDLENVNTRDIVNEVIESLQLVIDEKKAQIIYPDSMPNLYINRIHFTQLIQNLISNALKFVEKSPIICIVSNEDKEHVLLSVHDNGIGINPESGKKLFQLFHRLHRDSTRFEGTGIGLALCKTIVEKYGGRIWFESIEGRGTTFFMEFSNKQVDIEFSVADKRKIKHLEMTPKVNDFATSHIS